MTLRLITSLEERTQINKKGHPEASFIFIPLHPAKYNAARLGIYFTKKKKRDGDDKA